MKQGIHFKFSSKHMHVLNDNYNILYCGYAPTIQYVIFFAVATRYSAGRFL